LKKFETTKLFYDQYMYKLVVYNPFGHIFRQKNLSSAKTFIDTLQTQFLENKPLEITTRYRRYSVRVELFLEVKKLYEAFEKQTAYKLRIENTTLSIYSNNLAWLKQLARLVESPRGLWQPRKEAEDILREANVIVTRNRNEYQYLVRLAKASQAQPGLADWIRNNPDKAKAGQKALRRIDRTTWGHGAVSFYVRDERILHLISLMVDKINRVDKLVYVEDAK